MAAAVPRRGPARRRAGLAGAALLLPALAAAQILAVGSTLATRSLEDQHGSAAAIDARTRILVVSRDMKGGDVVKETLAGKEQSFLDARGAVYVADVSRMPSMITSMVALPRMRKRPYRVLVDREGALAREIPALEGTPTVVRLDDLRVTEIAHPASAAELTALLETAPTR
jgi:hypothetical protein